MQRFEGVIAMLPPARRKHPDKRFRSLKNGEVLVAPTPSGNIISTYVARSLAALHEVRVQASKACRVELWDSKINACAWSHQAPKGLSMVSLAEGSVMLVALREHPNAFYFWKLKDMRGRGEVFVESSAFFYIKPLEVAK